MTEIPTMTEAGVTDFRSGTFFGMMAPPNTPPAIADKISSAVHEIVRQQEVIAKLREIMLEPVGSTPVDTRSSWPAKLPCGARSSRPLALPSDSL